jgi:hypothetical protein
MVGGWRKLHIEDLHNLYALPYARVIKSRSMRWVDHVAHRGQMRNSYKIMAEKSKYLGVDGRIILE